MPSFCSKWSYCFVSSPRPAYLFCTSMFLLTVSIRETTYIWNSLSGFLSPLPNLRASESPIFTAWWPRTVSLSNKSTPTVLSVYLHPHTAFKIKLCMTCKFAHDKILENTIFSAMLQPYKMKRAKIRTSEAQLMFVGYCVKVH